MDDKAIEAEIQAKGLTAPRVTQAMIDGVIRKAEYFVFPGSQLTVCCLTLANGFTVTGESACASPENFDEELGKQIAFGKARDKIWTLEAYLLKQELFLAHDTDAQKLKEYWADRDKQKSVDAADEDVATYLPPLAGDHKDDFDQPRNRPEDRSTDGIAAAIEEASDKLG